MKKVLAILLATMLALVVVGSVMALPVEFSETFLGQQYNHSSDTHFVLWEGYKARFAFNLSQLGGFARLYDDDEVLQTSYLPTEDETGYDPNEYFAPFEASLNFQFSSADAVPETVRIRAGFFDGDTLIAEKEYHLGYLDWRLRHHRQYATLSIDLGSLGLLDYLADGRFVSVALAPDVYYFWDNDFSIEWANLTAKANPVPEPATVLLMGIGLLGLGGYGRKRFKKN